jgi:hypothetical protein
MSSNPWTGRELKSQELEDGPVDYVTTAAKGALGAVPFIGSLLAELAGTAIPNQRIDRITQFALLLESRLGELERATLQARIATAEGADLMEEGMRQAASSLSAERREYIANLIANGLSGTDITDQESKHLLRILGELNDTEIIWLRFYADASVGGDQDFRRRHAAVLETEPAHMGSEQSLHDKNYLAKSYRLHLSRLGLLQERLAVDQKTKLLKVDSQGRTEVKGYILTGLGGLMLRSIGLLDGMG